MSQTNVKAIVVRALWTFVQAFLAVFLAGLTVSVNQVQLKALIIAAFAAGLSAIKNVIVQPTEVK